MRQRHRQLQRWLIVILCLAAFAWRLHDLGRQSLWRDEIDAVYFALRDLPQTLALFVETGQNGALFFLSLRPWLRLTGSSEFALRYPAVLISMLSVPLLWQVGRRLMPGRATPASGRWPALLPRLTVSNGPLLAATLLAANPYQTWYGQDGKMYAEVTFLALLAAWFWLRGIGRGGWRPWLGYLIVVSIGIYTHLLMVLLIPLGLVWFLISWRQSRQHKLGYLAALVGLTLPYLPLLAWQGDFLFSTEQLTAIPVWPLSDIVESVLLGQSYGVQQPNGLLELGPIFFLGAAGIFLGYLEIVPRQNDILERLGASRRHLLIFAWFIVPVLGIYLLSLHQPVFSPRYVIWIAPAAMMLIALGIQLLWHNRGRVAKAVALVLAAYTLLFWIGLGQQQKVRPIKPDLRSAVSHIVQSRDPDDLLIFQIPYMEITYRYYSGDQGAAPFLGSDVRLGRWVEGLWTNNQLGDDEAGKQVEREMAAMTKGAGDIWVMLSEAATWDQRQLMLAWLDDEATLIDLVNYQDVQVRHYRLP